MSEITPSDVGFVWRNVEGIPPCGAPCPVKTLLESEACFEVHCLDGDPSRCIVAESEEWKIYWHGPRYTLQYAVKPEFMKDFAIVCGYYGNYIRKSDVYRGEHGTDRERFIGSRNVFRRIPAPSAPVKTWTRDVVVHGKNKWQVLDIVKAGDLLMGNLYRLVSMKKVKFDQKFCPTEMVIEEPQAIPECEELDDDVYDKMKGMIDCSENIVKEGLCGVNSGVYHDVCWTMSQRLFREFKSIRYEDIRGRCSYNCVVRGVTKDGKPRTVFPMSPKLNALLNQKIGIPKVKLPENCVVVRGAKFLPFNYAYDVTSCDWRMFPYFKRWIREQYPEWASEILSKVLVCGEWKDLWKFPSGIGCLAESFTLAWVVAYLDLGNKDDYFQIQGDGVASQYQITDPHLIEFPRHTINGFRYYFFKSRPRYINGLAKLTTPVIYGTTRLRGLELYEFRRIIYIKLLNAEPSELPIRDKDVSRKFDEWSMPELMRYVQDAGVRMFDRGTTLDESVSRGMMATTN